MRKTIAHLIIGLFLSIAITVFVLMAILFPWTILILLSVAAVLWAGTVLDNEP